MADRRGRVTESDRQWVTSRRQRLMRDPTPDELSAFEGTPPDWCRRVVVVPHHFRCDKLAALGIQRWAVAAPTLPAIKAGLLRWSSRLHSCPEPDLGGLIVIRRLGPAE